MTSASCFFLPVFTSAGFPLLLSTVLPQGRPCRDVGCQWPQTLKGVLAPAWSSADLVPLGMRVTHLASDVSPSVSPAAPPEVCSVSPAPSSFQFISQICPSRGAVCFSDGLKFWCMMGYSQQFQSCLEWDATVICQFTVSSRTGHLYSPLLLKSCNLC